MEALVSYWLIHFWHLSTKCTLFEETWRKKVLIILYQTCISRADRKTKMTDLASNWLIHFWHLICTHCRRVDETWREASTQRPLPSLCFCGRLKFKESWLAESFSTYPMQAMCGIWRKHVLSVIYQACVLGPIGKQRWPPWPLIGWNISAIPLENVNEIWRNLRGRKYSM